MLSEIARRFLPDDLSPTTYGLGILQSKSYRILKMETAKQLKAFDLSTVDWAIIGSLSDTKSGMTLSELGEKLDVRSPLVTLYVNRLLETGLIERWTSERDLRSKIVHISAKGKKMVPIIEQALKQAVKPLFKDCSVRDLMGFVSVMSKVAARGKD